MLAVALVAGAGAAWHHRADIATVLSPIAGAKPEARETLALPEGRPVIVANVEVARDDLTYSAIGTGYAQRSVTLRAPSSGEITALAIEPGRKFAAGEVLMRLDDRDARLAVALAEARLARATSERDRYQALQDTGVAATARLEEAQTAFEVARIELDRARAELDDRTLRAPFDGVAGLAEVETGDRITADEPVAGFDDRSSILVEFDVPEALLGRVGPGVAVSASTPAVEGRSFEGEIIAIDSRVDAATRTARLRAAIANPADLLRPGASFALRMELPGPRYPAVPELALQFSRGSQHVWRVVDGRAEEVPVRLVRRRAGLVIVDGPLEEGDPVVVEGTQRLRPGIEVSVMNPEEDANS